MRKPHKKKKQAGARSCKALHNSDSLKDFKQGRRRDKIYSNVKSEGMFLSLAFHPRKIRALMVPVCTLGCSLHPEAIPPSAVQPSKSP